MRSSRALTLPVSPCTSLQLRSVRSSHLLEIDVNLPSGLAHHIYCVVYHHQGPSQQTSSVDIWPRKGRRSSRPSAQRSSTKRRLSSTLLSLQVNRLHLFLGKENHKPTARFGWSDEEKGDQLQEAEAALDQLKRWADVLGDSKCFGLLVSLHRAKGEPATALKVP